MAIEPRFLDGRQRTKPLVVKHERSTAKRFGGTTTIGSGNKGMKGDVHAGGVMYENKLTTKRSLSLKLDWLLKLRREARAANLEPALSIRFEEGGEEWVLVPLDRYQEMLAK